eukprot:3568604-Prymnesium_polylepis.1
MLSSSSFVPSAARRLREGRWKPPPSARRRLALADAQDRRRLPCLQRRVARRAGLAAAPCRR